MSKAYSALRAAAIARRDWAARLYTMPIRQVVAELDPLSSAELFDVVGQPWLFDRRIRRLADEILAWRSQSRARGVGAVYTKCVYWPDSCGFPSGTPDPMHLGIPDAHEPDGWVVQSFQNAITDRRSPNLRAFRHAGRYLDQHRGAHNLRSAIDRELHRMDNTMRFV